MLSVNSGTINGVECYVVIDVAANQYAAIPKITRFGDSLNTIFLSRDSLYYSGLPDVVPDLVYIADLPELNETEVIATDVAEGDMSDKSA